MTTTDIPTKAGAPGQGPGAPARAGGTTSAAPYIRYAGQRLLRAIITVVLVYTFVFLLVVVVPGNPIENRLSNPDLGYSQEEIDKLVAYYGLDRPLLEQFFVLAASAARGDFGLSLVSSRPVIELILQALPSTLALTAWAIGLALLFALAIAFLVYENRGPLGAALRNAPAFFHSVPNFLFGLFFIQFFAFQLGLFRITDTSGPVATVFAALVLSLPLSASIAQVLIAGIDEIRGQAYIDVARTKALSGVEIFFRHLLKPASLPSLTVLGLLVGEVLGGSIIIESIFGRNGLGGVVQDAVVAQDTPVLLAVAVLSAVVFVVINLAVDLIYPALDPRLRQSGNVASPKGVVAA